MSHELQIIISSCIRVWEIIRRNPGITLDGEDYPVATDLELLGLVESRTNDDGPDQWYVNENSL